LLAPNESARTCGDSTSHPLHPTNPLIPHTSYPPIHHPHWPYPSTPLPLPSPTSRRFLHHVHLPRPRLPFQHHPP
jgi:hypothetical protein